MTYQTCCGGIASDDPNVKEGSGPPYMFRNCFAAPSSEWSKTQWLLQVSRYLLEV
jgi:hypothetical protein